MAKQIIAVTDIIHNGTRINNGNVVNAKLFTSEQLTRLYERGVIKIVEEAELKPTPTLQDVTDETKDPTKADTDK